MSEESFIQVVLPLRLEWMPFYRCNVDVQRGSRVLVRFAGRNYVGLVYRTGVRPDVDESKVLPVSETRTGLEPVGAEEIEFWEFLSSYYMCSLGEVYKAAYPAGKIKAEQSRARKKGESGEAPARPVQPFRKPRPGKPLLLVGGGRLPFYENECREALDKGLNVLVLTPEIAAGAHLETLLSEAFPGLVSSVSSHLTPAGRRRIAENVRSSGGHIVVGTRSSLFLPFSRLGLIIIENEQDPLFKQTEPAPRYHARDAAVMLGRIHGAKVILGSPAPSLESCYNAQRGKYQLQQTGAALPEMTLIDISAERRKNGMIGRLSRKLLEAAAQCEGPVALIRGWEKADELVAEVALALPGRRVDILTVYEALSSGLQPYSLVAVLQADALMSADDFRADERAVQSIAMLREQCSGRFIVQTAKSEHPVFSNYDGIYPKLLEERKAFHLPPYTRLVDEYYGSKLERYSFSPDASLPGRKLSLLGRAREFERKTGGRVHVIFDVDPIKL